MQLIFSHPHFTEGLLLTRSRLSTLSWGSKAKLRLVSQCSIKTADGTVNGMIKTLQRTKFFILSKPVPLKALQGKLGPRYLYILSGFLLVLSTKVQCKSHIPNLEPAKLSQGTRCKRTWKSKGSFRVMCNK